MKRFTVKRKVCAHNGDLKWSVYDSDCMHSRFYTKKSAQERANELNADHERMCVEDELREAGLLIIPSTEGILSNRELLEIEERIEYILSGDVEWSEQLELNDLRKQVERSYRLTRINDIGFKLILGGAA